jgi:hypothetical protein
MVAQSQASLTRRRRENIVADPALKGRAKVKRRCAAQLRTLFGKAFPRALR